MPVFPSAGTKKGSGRCHQKQRTLCPARSIEVRCTWLPSVPEECEPLPTTPRIPYFSIYCSPHVRPPPPPPAVARQRPWH